jgi:hypothetical protein
VGFAVVWLVACLAKLRKLNGLVDRVSLRSMRWNRVLNDCSCRGTLTALAKIPMFKMAAGWPASYCAVTNRATVCLSAAGWLGKLP